MRLVHNRSQSNGQHGEQQYVAKRAITDVAMDNATVEEKWQNMIEAMKQSLEAKIGEPGVDSREIARGIERLRNVVIGLNDPS